MKYYYMDNDEINIRTKIRNLTSISANILPKTGKVILSCSNDLGEVISSSNSSKHFDLFLATLSRVYEDEKDKRNIIILNDAVKKILDSSIGTRYPDYFKEHTTYPYRHIDYQKYDITSLVPVIYEIISVIFGIEGIEITNFSNIKGIRDNFVVSVSTKTKSRIIPIKFSKTDDMSYVITLGNMYGSKSVCASIDFTNDALYVNFRVAGINISGKLVYSISNDVIEDVEVIYNDTPVMINTITIPKVEDEELKGKYPNHQIYRLPNDLYVAVLIDGDYKDVHFISRNNLSNKDRNISVRSALIDGLSCPIVSVKHIEEEFRISDDMSIVQEYFIDMPAEDEYYREVLANRVLFKVIDHGNVYYPEREDEIDSLKTLEEDSIRLVLEGKTE